MKKIAVFTLSSGKFKDIMKYACVTDLKNIVSDRDRRGEKQQKRSQSYCASIT